MWDLWLSAAFGVTAGGLFLGYWRYSSAANQLEVVDTLSPGQWHELMTRKGSNALYGGVVGRVACKKPLVTSSALGEHDIQAAVLRKRIIEHRHSFNHRSTIMPTTVTVANIIEASDFDLRDERSKHRVHVPNAKQLAQQSYLPFEVIRNTYEPANESLTTQVLAFLGNGQYIEGHQTIDEALRIDALVVGVGQLSFVGGTLVLTPMRGKPFVMTFETLVTYVAGLRSTARRFAGFAIFFAAIAAGLIGRRLYLDWREKQRRRQQEAVFEAVNQRIAQAARDPSTAPFHDGSNDDADPHNSCVICWAERRTVAVAPCGHFCLCTHCARHLMTEGQRKCPICRAQVDHVMAVFNA